MLHRGVGVGKILKIGNVFAVFDLGGNSCFGGFDLGIDRLAALGEGTAAVGSTEAAAPCTDGAVPIGTGHTAVQRQLVNLAAKLFLQMIGKRSIMFHHGNIVP